MAIDPPPSKPSGPGARLRLRGAPRQRLRAVTERRASFISSRPAASCARQRSAPRLLGPVHHPAQHGSRPPVRAPAVPFRHGGDRHRLRVEPRVRPLGPRPDARGSPALDGFRTTLAHFLAPTRARSPCPSIPSTISPPNCRGTGRYWIAPDAHVIGRVRLGRDVGVWFGAVLRGDNELIDIGEGTNIQEGAMLHTDQGSRWPSGPAAPSVTTRSCTAARSARTPDRHGRDGPQPRADRPEQPRRRQCPRHRRQGVPRQFAHRRRTGQGDPHARRGRRRAAALVGAHYVENWKRFAAGLRRID